MKIKNTPLHNTLQDNVRTIVKKCNPEKVILFGSYADGTPCPDSDIDLLIITRSDKSNWQISTDIALLLDHSFPVDIIVKSPKEVKERVKMGDFFLAHILKNGTLLYERTC